MKGRLKKSEVRMVKSQTCCLLMMTVLWVSACQVTAADDRAYVYPEPQWIRKAPDEAGFDKARLDAFVARVGHEGCVVRSGYLVRAWGRYDQKGDVASAAKPVYAHLVLASVQNGRLASLDDRIIEFSPGLKQLNAHLGYPDRGITWRHLVTQTSCYGVEEGPGEAFSYSDRQTALLIDLLVNGVYEVSLEQVDQHVLAPLLTDVIGCEDEPTMVNPKLPPGRLCISARDFARFGHLYLSQGRWAGRQVLDRAAFELTTSSPLSVALPRTKGVRAEMLPRQRSVGGSGHDAMHLNSYSYCWWLNGVMDDGRRVLPDLPEDTYGAFGHGGRHALVIIPSLDLVVVWLDGRRGRRADPYSSGGHMNVNEALKLLLESIE